MSKSKQARFHAKAGERILKQGMMDFCPLGGYGHAVPGDAVLTDRRFHFYAETDNVYAVEIPLDAVYAVEKIGVPFLTRSLRIVTDRAAYRFNAFFVGRWYRPVRRAAEAARAAAQSKQGAADARN